MPALRRRGVEHGELKEEKAEKPVRTHWDMLLERRSVKELEEILAERLELRCAAARSAPHLHRPAKKKAKTA